MEELETFDFSPDIFSSSIDTRSEMNQRRKICPTCDKPTTVCLCAFLPSQPIPTSTQIIIIQHPHEFRHKLATVPVLSKCLRNFTTIIGRRLRPGISPLLDSLHATSLQNPNQPHRVAYLFPGSSITPAVPIDQLESSGLDLTNLVLIVIDGTWNHAKEMVKASMEFLSKFAIRVGLECDEGVEGGSIFGSDLILRKEPFGGCMSTMEAVARALCLIEPNGDEIEASLIEVLKAMVGFQARNLKPFKPKIKMVKKSKRNSKT